MANIQVKKTESEKWMAEYLESHGYVYEFEREFGDLTKPDYRIERDGISAICEVKEFKTSGLMKYMDDAPGRFVIRDTKDILLPVRTQIKAAARQLKPYKEMKVPLVVILSNPLNAWVDLDDHSVISAMYGDPQIVLSKNEVGEIISSHQTGRNGKLTNHHKHISAIVVLKRQFIGKSVEDVLPLKPVNSGFSLQTEPKTLQAQPKDTYSTEYSYCCSVIENLSSECTPVPMSIFNGENDSRWRIIEGQMTKVL